MNIDYALFDLDLSTNPRGFNLRLLREMTKIYNIRVQSPFVLIPRQVKEKLGIGYKVLEIAVENEVHIPEITDVASASEAIVKTGYRALARANHPDLGGDVQVMSIINQSKKELLELLEQLNGNTI